MISFIKRGYLLIMGKKFTLVYLLWTMHLYHNFVIIFNIGNLQMQQWEKLVESAAGNVQILL